jgi:hypothetical protein
VRQATLSGEDKSERNNGWDYWYYTYLMCAQFISDSTIGHQNLLQQKKILHRDISIGNVVITESETEGFLVNLDHAIQVNREDASGAKGRIGSRAFMSIGLLLQWDNESRQPHNFMNDL